MGYRQRKEQSTTLSEWMGYEGIYAWYPDHGPDSAHLRVKEKVRSLGTSPELSKPAQGGMIFTRQGLWWIFVWAVCRSGLSRVSGKRESSQQFGSLRCLYDRVGVGPEFPGKPLTNSQILHCESQKGFKGWIGMCRQSLQLLLWRNESPWGRTTPAVPLMGSPRLPSDEALF